MTCSLHPFPPCTVAQLFDSVDVGWDVGRHGSMWIFHTSRLLQSPFSLSGICFFCSSGQSLVLIILAGLLPVGWVRGGGLRPYDVMYSPSHFCTIPAVSSPPLFCCSNESRLIPGSRQSGLGEGVLKLIDCVFPPAGSLPNKAGPHEADCNPYQRCVFCLGKFVVADKDVEM